MKTRRPSFRSAAMGSVLMGLISESAECQLSPVQVNELEHAVGKRIEALTILGGDFGLAGGNFRDTGTFTTGGTADAQLTVTKFGGSGDIGDPQPLDGLSVGWQPRLQGNMGFLKSTNHIHTPRLDGDISTLDVYAIEFGGGARFWMNDNLSLAPTLMGIYGRTSNSYTANSAFMTANLARATQMGLVDWTVNTWTVRPALNIQYVFDWKRAIVTLSSDPTYFHTESFAGPGSTIRVNGDSGFVTNKIDVDVPLGLELLSHELRSGGYFSRTELFGGLRDGLDQQHLYELHGRIVLDFLNQLWKVQWVGLGVSYVWGPSFTGWTGGADVAFRF